MGMFDATQVDKSSTNFGGSEGAADQFFDRVKRGYDTSNREVYDAKGKLREAETWGRIGLKRGDELVRQYTGGHGTGLGAAAMRLSSFKSHAGSVADAATKAALARGAQDALSVAAASSRGGNSAAAARGAIMAQNATAGQVAMDARTQAAQQKMAEEQMQIQAQQAALGSYQALLNSSDRRLALGMQASQAGVGHLAGLGQSLLQLGAGRESMFLGAEQNALGLQSQLGTQVALTEAQLEEEAKRRQLQMVGTAIQGAGSVASLGF